MQEHSNVEGKNKICFFPTLRWCDTLICAFMSSSFRKSGQFLPFQKHKTDCHNRMKQRLERRMLRDRCKTFISDHVFQELSQDANNDLQNPQEGSTLGGALGMILVSSHTFSGVDGMSWGSSMSFDLHLLDGK